MNTIPKPIQEVFDDLIAQFATKNKEYQGETKDLFRNFSQGAALSSEKPEQVLLWYVNKQIVSLYDAKSHHPERLTDINFVNEKAGDIAVYMVLLMAMVRLNEKRIIECATDIAQDIIANCQRDITGHAKGQLHP